MKKLLVDKLVGLCKQDKEEIRQVLAWKEKYKNFQKTIDKINKR